MSEALLIDSPYANLANIRRALGAAGAAVLCSSDPERVAEAKTIVLPGVGSFRAAMGWLRDRTLDRAIRRAVDRGARLLGVCVGHQLLFDASEEMGHTPGLGLIPGQVVRFEGSLPIPQIGWNRVRSVEHPLFEGIAPTTSFYFVHSFHARPVSEALAIGTAEYAGEYVAAVAKGRVCGVQFHPEKSAVAGLRILRNFLENVA